MCAEFSVIEYNSPTPNNPIGTWSIHKDFMTKKYFIWWLDDNKKLDAADQQLGKILLDRWLDYHRLSEYLSLLQKK